MTVQKLQSQTLKMYSHDALCPNAELFNMGPTSICLYCHVIRNTRKDERARALRDVVEAVSAVPDDFGSSAEWDRDYDVDQTGQTRNPRIWVREAVAAIEELGAGR